MVTKDDLGAPVELVGTPATNLSSIATNINTLLAKSSPNPQYRRIVLTGGRIRFIETSTPLNSGVVVVVPDSDNTSSIYISNNEYPTSTNSIEIKSDSLGTPVFATDLNELYASCSQSTNAFSFAAG